MRRIGLHLPLYVTVPLTLAAVVALGAWLGTVILGSESATVDWALRLPKERERARKAGLYPPFPKQTDHFIYSGPNAADEYERLDAVIRANTPDGKLPSNKFGSFIVPEVRTKKSQKTAEALLERYGAELLETNHIAVMPNCRFQKTPGTSRISGYYTAVFFDKLHLAAAICCQQRGRYPEAIAHIITAIRIDHQLERQATIGKFGDGYFLEKWAYKVLIEGLTVSDVAKRNGFLAAIHSIPEEDRYALPPATELAIIARSEIEHSCSWVDTMRREGYKSHASPFADYSPMTRYLDRLNYDLETRAWYDSWEAEACYDTAGMAIYLRSLSSETRLYSVWKATQQWSRQADIAFASLPENEHGYDWERPLYLRIERDTQKSLATALILRLRGDRTKLPDDPFAPRSGVSLRESQQANGNIVIYSIGENGRDDGGDQKQDVAVTIPHA